MTKIPSLLEHPIYFQPSSMLFSSVTENKKKAMQYSTMTMKKKAWKYHFSLTFKDSKKLDGREMNRKEIGGNIEDF